VSARERLGRVFGPDTLELLGAFIGERVEEVLLSSDHGRRWLTPEAAADRYGVSASALRKRVARGTLPHSRMGRRLLIDTRALERQLERERR
jgi:excisionase family DNA binding protein